MIPFPSWGSLPLTNERGPVPWGWGAHRVGSKVAACSRCGKRSRTKSKLQCLNWFGADGDGGEYGLCAECCREAWTAAAAELDVPELRPPPVGPMPWPRDEHGDAAAEWRGTRPTLFDGGTRKAKSIPSDMGAKRK